MGSILGKICNTCLICNVSTDDIKKEESEAEYKYNLDKTLTSLKGSIKQLDDKIDENRIELRGDIKELKNDMKDDMKDIRDDVKFFFNRRGD